MYVNYAPRKINDLITATATAKRLIIITVSLIKNKWQIHTKQQQMTLFHGLIRNTSNVIWWTVLGYLCRFNNGDDSGNEWGVDNCFRFQYQICLSMPVHGFISSLVPSAFICRQRFVLRCSNVLSCDIHSKVRVEKHSNKKNGKYQFQANLIFFFINKRASMPHCWNICTHHYMLIDLIMTLVFDTWA